MDEWKWWLIIYGVNAALLQTVADMPLQIINQ